MSGELVWRKRLSKTDAQRQNGNQTGDIRLTQARFVHRGKVIDQTQYFRETVFGKCRWEQAMGVQGLKSPYTFREKTRAKFRIIIDEERDWTLKLEIGHKPSGEAKQGNYTTGIRWGPVMMSFLESEMDVTGLELELFKLGGDEFEMRISEK